MAVRSPVLCKERTLLIFPVTYSDWSNPWHDLHWWIPALESWMLKDSKKWHCKIDQAIWCYLTLFAHVSHAYMSEFLSSKNEMILESNWGSQKASSAGSKGCGHSLLTAATTHWTVPLRDRKSFPWEWRVVPRGLGLPISGLRLGNHGQTIGRWLRQSLYSRTVEDLEGCSKTTKGHGKVVERHSQWSSPASSPEHVTVGRIPSDLRLTKPRGCSLVQNQSIGPSCNTCGPRRHGRGSLVNLGFWSFEGAETEDLLDLEDTFMIFHVFFLLHLIRAISPVAGG